LVVSQTQLNGRQVNIAGDLLPADISTNDQRDDRRDRRPPRWRSGAIAVAPENRVVLPNRRPHTA
jgi:hypothetical protein